MRRIFYGTMLALLLLLSGCAAEATTMHLRQTEGQVAVADDEGEAVRLRDDLSLYSGYGVETRAKSYAWIDLDRVKLTKMDEDSEISITKHDDRLRIRVERGSFFFRVTEPLEEDERMTIRTSNLVVGIRGTCGWVEAQDGVSRVYLLEGKVECEAGLESMTVRAGEMAERTEDGPLTVRSFPQEEIPAYILPELADAPEWIDDLPTDAPEDAPPEETPPEEEAPAEDASPEEEEPVPTGDEWADALAAYRYLLSDPEAHLGAWSGEGTDTKEYTYALVLLEPEDPSPTLLLRRWIEVEGATRGSIALFYYSPAAGRALQTSTGFSTGFYPEDGKVQGLYRPLDGDGLLFVLENVGVETFYSRRYRDGNTMEQVPCQKTPAEELDWRDAKDLSYLETWTPPTPQEAPLPEDEGRIVFRGALGAYSYQEVLDLQGIPDPNPGSSGTYYLIVLDEPQTMYLRTADPTSSFRNYTVRLVDVSSIAGIEQYVGQHLTCSVDPDRTWMPSDTSLPMGEPTTEDLRILEP